jgi:large subunit ribosomal protein L24
MIKKGDNVLILTGSNKGAKGAVEKILKSENKVIVAGVNVHKKVIKAKQRGEKHTLVETAFPVHISNVALIDPSSGKPTRVGTRKDGAKKVRVAKKSGKDIA